MSRRAIKVATSTMPTIIPINDPPSILPSVEVVHSPPPSKIPSLPLGQAAVTLTGSPTLASIPEPTPLIWRYKDVDIELGNKFPYVLDDATDVTDFEVSGKVVKSFLSKDPMYNQNLNVKATAEDVS